VFSAILLRRYTCCNNIGSGIVRSGPENIKSLKQTQVAPKVSFFLLLEMKNTMKLSYPGDREKKLCKI
jgi:hypothetical protein